MLLLLLVTQLVGKLRQRDEDVKKLKSRCKDNKASMLALSNSVGEVERRLQDAERARDEEAAKLAKAQARIAEQEVRQRLP